MIVKYNYLFLLNFLVISILPSIYTGNPKLPLVINTWNFTGGNEAAWASLNSGNSPLDALVDGLAFCEDNPSLVRYAVGYGGSPDENGETTLDSMIMDGATMNVGSAGGLRRINEASRVARMILEHTRHTLLVGDAASNFADMMGFSRMSLNTARTQNMWQEWRNNNCQPNFWVNVTPDPTKHCGPYKPINKLDAHDYDYTHESPDINEHNHDTIGVIVVSSEGHICAGTSTNGIAYKMAGRLGDSPIVGSGGYADNEAGAAVCTGDGDIMMLFSPSIIAVEYLRMGLSPDEATDKVMRRIIKHYPDFEGALIVVDRWGNYSVVCVAFPDFTYTITSGQTNTKVVSQKCIEKNKVFRKYESDL